MSTISAGTTSTTALVNTGDTTGNLVFQTNGTTTAMTIDTSQNVGVGTASPAYKLDVNGVVKNTGAFRSISGSVDGIFGAGQFASGVVGLGSVSNHPLTFNTNLTEYMRIDTSGNVGIGTSSPATPLTLGNNRTLSWLNSAGSYNGTSTGAQILKFSDNNLYIDNLDGGAMIFRRSSGPTETMRLTGAGEMWVASTTDQGAYNIQCGGTGVWGAGAYVNGSDARLKENVQTLTDGLSVVTQLRPVTFQYKSDYSKDTSVQPGFIAQELQAALQGKDYVDGVVQAGPEYLNVAYQTLIPVLVKAIQELKTQNDELRARVAALEGAK